MGYNCAVRPAWSFTNPHPDILPVIEERVVEKVVEMEKVVEKVVEVEKIIEVEKIVEVDKPAPVLDYAALLREPKF